MAQFNGLKLYVGIDVHKKSWHVSIYGEYNEFKTFSQPPSSKILATYLKQHFPGGEYYAAYEAGFSGFQTYYDLTSLGIKTLVVNAADVPTTDKEKRHKSDTVDSKKLGKSLRAGTLTGIHIPSLETLQDRSVLRYRNKLIADQTRYKNRIKHFLHYHGISIPQEFDNRGWTNQFVEWLNIQAENYWALQHLITQFTQCKQHLKEVNQKLLEIAKKEKYQKRFQLIKSIPGLGNLSAIHILLELENIQRFRTNEQLASYVGLTPTRHSSGETERIGPMTPRGNKLVKKYLIEASWIVVRKDPEMMAVFAKLCHRMIKTKAIVRIARKILNRIKAVLTTERPYQINYNL